MVFGDGQPALCGRAVAAATRPPTTPRCRPPSTPPTPTLPDYARIGRWVRGRAAFDAASGLATANGRPQRAAILRAHADALGIAATDRLPPEHREHPMSFHARLLEQTASARQGLLATPIIQGALRGEVSLPSYVAFLREAYHHVRHTVPLLQATQGRAAGARTPGCAARWTSTSRRRPATTSGSSTTSAPAAAMPRRCATARPATPPR